MLPLTFLLGYNPPPSGSRPRRKWARSAAVLTVALLLTVASSAQSLRQLADRHRILIGAAVNPVYLTEPAYAETLAREFNMVEAEDAMKWTALRPNATTFDFATADKIVAFAEAHSMKVRGHTLVWSKHNPEWLEKLPYSPQQMSSLLHDHIQHTVEHFRGRVFAWDVVNEALDEHGKLRPSMWNTRPDYIEQAFRWAHAADPKALLFYNEAEAEALNQKSDAVYAMVKDFKQRGVPIDGVGLQLHILDLNFNAKSVAANIARITALGLQVQITELDVAIPAISQAPDVAHQAEIYRQVATVCLSNPGCTALQTWGFTDKYSWIGWFTNHTKGDALPFNRQYRPKPAYQALKQALTN